MKAKQSIRITKKKYVVLEPNDGENMKNLHSSYIESIVYTLRVRM